MPNYTKDEIRIIESIMGRIAGYYIDLKPETKGSIRDSITVEGYNYSYTGHIMGKMLTVIDSIMEDKERRDATKSLVKQIINEEKKRFINQLYNDYSGPKLLNFNCESEDCNFVTSNESGLCSACENK